MPASIAIYEDDAGIREVLLDLLETEGFEVIVCNSPFEIHQAAVMGARVALVDGWGSNYQALESDEHEQIRGLTRVIPTILLSGRTWATGLNACDLGLTAVLTKPFDVDNLLRELHPFGATVNEAPIRLPEPSCPCSPDRSPHSGATTPPCVNPVNLKTQPRGA